MQAAVNALRAVHGTRYVYGPASVTICKSEILIKTGELGRKVIQLTKPLRWSANTNSFYCFIIIETFPGFDREQKESRTSTFISNSVKLLYLLLSCKSK